MPNYTNDNTDDFSRVFKAFLDELVTFHQKEKHYAILSMWDVTQLK